MARIRLGNGPVLPLGLALLLLHAPLELAVTPRVCLPPCDVRVTVRIDPHPLNRWFVVQLDGPMYQGGEYPLDGDRAPTTQPFIWFLGLPAGDYSLVAVLYRASDPSEAGRIRTTVQVVRTP